MCVYLSDEVVEDLIKDKSFCAHGHINHSASTFRILTSDTLWTSFAELSINELQVRKKGIHYYNHSCTKFLYLISPIFYTTHIIKVRDASQKRQWATRSTCINHFSWTRVKNMTSTTPREELILSHTCIHARAYVFPHCRARFCPCSLPTVLSSSISHLFPTSTVGICVKQQINVN